MSDGEGGYETHMIWVAVLTVVVFLVVGIGMSLAQGNWGPARVSVFDDTPVEPMPWALQHPWIVATATALNVLILGRAWIFFLRPEAVAWRVIADRRDQRATVEHERRLTARGNVPPASVRTGLSELWSTGGSH